MPAGIFARSLARPGATKNSVYPYILGHFAHPPFQPPSRRGLPGRAEPMSSSPSNTPTRKSSAFMHRGRPIALRPWSRCRHRPGGGAWLEAASRSWLHHISGDFQDEVECLGIEASPSFVREP
jgi:hypothetical protein